MITPKILAEAFYNNVEIVKMQAAGLSQADSLVQLPFRANCFNWVVGHLVSNRRTVLKLLGDEQTIDGTLIAHYEYNSEPITGEGEGVLPLEQLMDLLDLAQAQIAKRLAAITDDELAQPLSVFGGKQRTLGEWLFFFYFHDCYHTGQTEILRQAAGKDDKIIKDEHMTIIDTMIGVCRELEGYLQIVDVDGGSAIKSLSSAIVSPMVNGKFVCIEYTWMVDGNLVEGEYFIGFEPRTQLVTMVWVDAWHNGERFVICQGEVPPDGALNVLGAYPAPEGPDWGWRTVIAPGEGSFSIRM